SNIWGKSKSRASPMITGAVSLGVDLGFGHVEKKEEPLTAHFVSFLLLLAQFPQSTLHIP
ncbi:unnamed protein product, partial [Amoebophrya sp. A120]